MYVSITDMDKSTYPFLANQIVREYETKKSYKNVY